MKILVLGNGAREHAICEALARSAHSPNIFNFATTKNPGIISLATEIEVGNIMDFQHFAEFARRVAPDFAIIGPDDPICAGAADVLLPLGIPSIAPLKALAQLEGSKSFTRDLLEKYTIEGNPKYRSFTDETGMIDFAEECGEIVVKADGLCGGKGVRVQGDHFQSLEGGLRYARECLKKDGRVVLEERLVGEEFSLLFFCDGTVMIPMPIIQDHKRAFSGDRGPNTGGMGTISAADHTLPFLFSEEVLAAQDLSAKVIGALQDQEDAPFVGILFGGFMVTKNGVRLIEFNTRFGDPESLNIFSLLETDFVDICKAMLAGTLDQMDITFAKKASVCKYIVPEGYPEKAEKGVPILFSPQKVPAGVSVFFGSLDEEMRLGGSRTMAFVATGKTILEAEILAEEAMTSVKGLVFHREDIGTEKLLAKRMAHMSLIRTGLSSK